MRLFLKSDGFSLIEVLIAIVILSISLLGLASLMATTSRNTSFGGHLTEAATYSQDQLEQLRVDSWGGANLTNGAHNNTVPAGISGISYDRNWTVVANGNIKQVTITISWNDQTAHSFSLVSAIANPNP